jgi:subtilisin family serine protease
MRRTERLRVWRLAVLPVAAAAGIGWAATAMSARATQAPQTRTPTAWIDAVSVAQAQARGLDYVPGDVIFKFKTNTPTVFQQRALAAIRSRPRLTDVRWSHDVGYLHDATQPDARVLAQQLAEQSEVEFASPNYIRHLTPLATRAAGPGSPVARAGAPTRAVPAAASFTPNDPDFGRQWDLPLIQMPDAWGLNPGGSASITVAVIDTGITSVNQTLTAPLWNGSAFVSTAIPFAKSPDLSASRLVNPLDLVFSPNNNVLDMDGHSTHVASTIGEDTNNNFALAGMAFNVKIMPIKVCTGYWETMIQLGQAGTPGFASPDAGGCPDIAIIAALHAAADAGAKVINLSLGGSEPDAGLQAAMVYAVSKGAFVAVAMGNDFGNGNPTEFPAFYAAQIDGAMSVASVSASMAHASYSSSGSYCEIAAPGGDGPDSANNSFVWQVTLDFDTSLTTLLAPRFDKYLEIGMAGTSMATPHVAGLAALIMSQYPHISPAAVEALIESTAVDLGSPGRDSLFGFGLIQARAALFGKGLAK